ncbi:MAG: hypothetical protein AAFO06_21120 [Cyanobacteria bacterium J06597_16]
MLPNPSQAPPVQEAEAESLAQLFEGPEWVGWGAIALTKLQNPAMPQDLAMSQNLTDFWEESPTYQPQTNGSRLWWLKGLDLPPMEDDLREDGPWR